MTQIEQIRAEIERLSYEEQGFNSEDAEYGYRSCARDLLSFLSTLESEKPIEKGLEKELEKEINKAMKSDLCPEEISDYDFCCIARHFAQWGAEHLKKKKNVKK